MPDNTALIADLMDAIENARNTLREIEQAQDDNSDEGNEDAIVQVTASLDNAETYAYGLVP